MRNLVSDVSGVRVGHAEDEAVITGATAIVFDEPAVASVDIRGGAPGSHESEMLLPERTIERVDAIILSGGSAFGLEAASGAMATLAAQGRGHVIRTARVPIVPAAILFDLLNGGDKNWGDAPLYRRLGSQAVNNAAVDFDIGSVGAGLGATTFDLKGGLGSASAMTGDGTVIGAIVAVNAVGRVTLGESRHFWAAPFEVGDEFGGHGLPPALSPDMTTPHFKGEPVSQPGEATTIAAIVTDAALTKSQCRQLAIMAQDGLPRAIFPVHTLHDGDTVFAAATGLKPLSADPLAISRLGHLAAITLARAIARAVYEASDDKGTPLLPSYRRKWGA